MNKFTRIAGEAAVGLGIGIGIDEPYVSPENQPAHVALILGSQDSESPALPAKIPVELNRQERRLLKLPCVTYVPAESPEHNDLLDRVVLAREQITKRTALARKGRK